MCIRDRVITIPLEPRSDERTDRSIENSGVNLDFENSSVVELELESNWLVATVDVGQFNRTILVDTLSFNQSIISNPRWDSSSPSIGNGMVAFLQVTRDDLNTFGDGSERNNDLYVHYLESSQTDQLTNDEDVDQSLPQTLSKGIAFIEEDEEGQKTLGVHSFEDTIEDRNRLLLQATVLVLIPLIFLWVTQSFGADQILTRQV